MSDNTLPTTDALLVIRSKMNLTSKEHEQLFNSIQSMKAFGVVIVPAWCEVLVVPNDISIKLEEEK